MNLRRFLYIVTNFLIICLTIGGSSLLLLAKVPVAEEPPAVGYLGSVIQPLKVQTEPFNVLLLGGDKVGANTDTIIVANVNTNTGKINIISIPRDTKINIKGSTVPKINSAYSAGGADLAVKSVSQLLNINIKYYVFINTEGFREIVDILGGVDFEILANMDYDDPTQNLHIHLKKGYQHLDGAKAEQYMRFRQPNVYTKEIEQYYDGSDLKRIEAQQRFIKEVINQKLNIRYFTKADEIVAAVFKYLETNITMEESVKIVNSATNIKGEDVTFYKLPGNPSDEGISYFIIDKKQTQEIIKENFQTR